MWIADSRFSLASLQRAFDGGESAEELVFNLTAKYETSQSRFFFLLSQNPKSFDPVDLNRQGEYEYEDMLTN